MRRREIDTHLNTIMDISHELFNKYTDAGLYKYNFNISFTIEYTNQEPINDIYRFDELTILNFGEILYNYYKINNGQINRLTFIPTHINISYAEYIKKYPLWKDKYMTIDRLQTYLLIVLNNYICELFNNINSYLKEYIN